MYIMLYILENVLKFPKNSILGNRIVIRKRFYRIWKQKIDDLQIFDQNRVKSMNIYSIILDENKLTGTTLQIPTLVSWTNVTTNNQISYMILS
jgi:hypothetical protein